MSLAQLLYHSFYRRGKTKVVEKRASEERDNAVRSQELNTLLRGRADVHLRKTHVSAFWPSAEQRTFVSATSFWNSSGDA